MRGGKYGRILSDEENRMVVHFYEEMGFDCPAADEEQTVWTYPVDGYTPRNRYVEQGSVKWVTESGIVESYPICC